MNSIRLVATLLGLVCLVQSDQTNRLLFGDKVASCIRSLNETLAKLAIPEPVQRYQAQVVAKLAGNSLFGLEDLHGDIMDAVRAIDYERQCNQYQEDMRMALRPVKCYWSLKESDRESNQVELDKELSKWPIVDRAFDTSLACSLGRDSRQAEVCAIQVNDKLKALEVPQAIGQLVRSIHERHQGVYNYDIKLEPDELAALQAAKVPKECQSYLAELRRLLKGVRCVSRLREGPSTELFYKHQVVKLEELHLKIGAGFTCMRLLRQGEWAK